jgi:tRNA (mo5U34)-methyltransferase
MKLYELFVNMRAKYPEHFGRIQALKSAHPEIDWYPFHTEWKLDLICRHIVHFEANEVRSIAERPRIIDIGAADGDLAFMFEMHGCEVVAVEYPPINYNRCRGIEAMKTYLLSNIDLKNINIDFEAIEVSQRNDVAICLDVLYHLKNPIFALVNLLEVSDYLFLSTRIFESIGSTDMRNAPVGYLLKPFEAAKDDPSNYWMFTEKGFETLINRSGWEIVDRSYFGYEGVDSHPFRPDKDKRIVCLCKRKYEQQEVIAAYR